MNILKSFVMKYNKLITFAAITALLLITSCSEPQKKENSNTTGLTEQKTRVGIVLVSPLKDSARQYKLMVAPEEDTSRGISILIGENEGQVLTLEAKNIKTQMPQPLDLLKLVIQKSGYHVQEVMIDSLQGDIYVSKVLCVNQSGNYVLRSRTSDAVALAYKFNCPIYINNALLKK